MLRSLTAFIPIAGDALCSVLTPEEPPRWPALSEILSEIRAEVAAAAADESQGPPPLWPEKVLVVAADLAACRRIKEVRVSV